jgi:hypothetical protein
MYFCPNCSYILDISKSSAISKDDAAKIPLTKISDAFKILDNNDDITKYKAEFSKEDFYKNKKIKNYDKNVLNQLFNDVVLSGEQFICNNCNHKKQINETTLLYQINLEDTSHKIYNIEENKLIVNDPLLPHTRDYTCKNINCSTYKNNNLKDAVFYKNKNSYKVNYICTVCFFNW